MSRPAPERAADAVGKCRREGRLASSHQHRRPDEGHRRQELVAAGLRPASGRA